MASKIFSVNSYEVHLGYKSTTEWGGVNIQSQGFVTCFGPPPPPGTSPSAGPPQSRFIVYGLHPSSPVPSTPVYNVQADVGAIFVPFNDLHNYVDIVRHERPVFAYLDSVNPTWMELRTGQEHVGEDPV
jgi:hypothetical protein